MFSLQQIFSRDEQFFQLLEASAEECRVSVQALKHIVASGPSAPNLDEFIAPRRKEKQISSDITALLARVSVTALDREDIEALSNALYKIPKTLEKFAERFILAASELRDIDFSRHVILLEQATDITLQMLKELRRGFHMDKISELNSKLQSVEGEGDALILSLLKSEIYSGKHPALKVIILKDLYELLEKGVDRCRDAGNVISEIVLKNT
jgi:uncharacterized protein Yka (UPF0111/DUF47 family)